MNQSRIQRFLRYLNLKQAEVRLNSPACCDSLRQSRQECDHSLLSTANATDSQSLDTRDKPLVNLSKESSNNNRQNEQKYYLCDYQYEGEKWCIEIPAESWEDAKARLKRLAYAEVVGEVKGVYPIELGLWVKFLVWLKRLV